MNSKESVEKENTKSNINYTDVQETKRNESIVSKSQPVSPASLIEIFGETSYVVGDSSNKSDITGLITPVKDLDEFCADKIDEEHDGADDLSGPDELLGQTTEEDIYSF